MLPGLVTITFDGWGDDYDYTSPTTSDNLHPVGFCESRGSSLSAPRAYGRPFEWIAYLEETKSTAVAYDLFNKVHRARVR